MRILIICSFFPPDTEIGAVKPYMIAKYLSKFGHTVTVLRTGYIKEKADDSYGDYKKGMEVLTAMGEDSDVAKFERGELIAREQKKKIFKVPKTVDLAARFILQPVITLRRIKNKNYYFSFQQNVIDKLKEKNRSFDIVYSTFFELENIFAGEYASRIFGAKWIMEFRDPIKDTKVINYPGFEVIWNMYARRVQEHAVKTCDLCTCVSEGLAAEFRKLNPDSDIRVMYNGYDSSDYLDKNAMTPKDSEYLTICYTGTLWGERIYGLEALLECISGLITSKKIDKNRIHIHYAGRHSAEALEACSRKNLTNVLIDYGYVTRDEAERIQLESDIYLVLSWNTKKSQGVMTGKFFEGIRAEKPILSIIYGDVPESELYLINKKYEYGYCYEMCRKGDEMDRFSAFLEKMYNEKMQNGRIDYNMNPNLKKKFHYKYISKEFEKWCEEKLI